MPNKTYIIHVAWALCKLDYFTIHSTIGKISIFSNMKKMLPQVGFEPGTSLLLQTIVTERSRVRIPVKPTVLLIFSYCA